MSTNTLPQQTETETETTPLLVHDTSTAMNSTIALIDDSIDDEEYGDHNAASHNDNNNNDYHTTATSFSAWGNYNAAVEKYPLLVKGVTAFFILGLGDFCGQAIQYLQYTTLDQNNINNNDDDVDTVNNVVVDVGFIVDWMQTLRFACFGLVGAPWAHYYFRLLDHCLPPTPHKPLCAKVTWMKLFIDQGLQAPIMLALIISTLAILKGGGWHGLKLDMQLNYWNALIVNWKLWIPASLVNLAFVKPTLRVLYVNVVFFIWTIILSIMLNND